MTSKEFVDTLKHIADGPTVYNNKFPYNCGYWDGKRFSFDCWNLIKSVINGWKDNRTVGYYNKSFKYTEDCDGLTLLNNCTVKSKDFTKLSIPGTYLFIRNCHAGVYIGEIQINGKLYNVIESTTSYNANKVTYSWTDTDGTRRPYKGGSKSSKKWTDWGLLKYIEYTEEDKNNAQVLPNIKPVVTKEFNNGDIVTLTPDATYVDGGKIPSFVKNSTLYFRGYSGKNCIISTLKEGAITGVVSPNYINKKKQVQEEEKEPLKPVIKTYIITSKIGLNIRMKPDQNSTRIAGMNYNTKFNVDKIENGWGHIPEKDGWSCLDYAKEI